MPITLDDVLLQIKKEGYWSGKYVRLSKSGLRLGRLFTMGYVFGDAFDDHLGLAGGEISQVESASYLRVNKKNFRVEGSSMTTKKSWDEKDIENFQIMFNVPPEN